MLTTRIARYLLAAATLLLSNSHLSATEQTTPATAVTSPPVKSIIVTQKPLYTLVAQITTGAHQPELLIEQAPSSHHYSLRPSQRRALADADIIVWIGPQLEPYLSKSIRPQAVKSATSTVITAMHASRLTLLKRRYGHDQTKTPSAEISDPQAQDIDPHIWLSIENAEAISRHISAALSKRDPRNATIYKKNLQRLLSHIEHTRQTINDKLKSVDAQQYPFLSYHDAFQYFERENQLRHIDSVSYNEHTGPGLKHMREIRRLITEKDIRCLVYQAPKPSIVDSLTQQTAIKATELDPLGRHASSARDAWFDIMQQLADGFASCLSR